MPSIGPTGSGNLIDETPSLTMKPDTRPRQSKRPSFEQLVENGCHGQRRGRTDSANATRRHDRETVRTSEYDWTIFCDRRRTLSSFVSALAVAAWVHDLGKQVPCAPSDAPLFDIPTVGVILTVVLLLGGMAVVVVSQWRKPHRIAATIGAAILATSLLWILAAVAFRHGNVSACFPAF